jgi:hypothetical protein
VTLNTGDVFHLTLPAAEGGALAFVGFVSNEPITQIVFDEPPPLAYNFNILNFRVSAINIVPEARAYSITLLGIGVLCLARIWRRLILFSGARLPKAL